jgi:dephospho-CoA kinase
VLGVLGGIASGKSRVAALLAGPDGVVIDADRLAHEALALPEVRQQVVARVGAQVLDPSGAVDRAALGRAVFDSPELRRELEGWIHPRVRRGIASRLDRARADGVPTVVLDVPLLFENDAQHGLVAACDLLVFVEAPDQLRDERARARRGWEAGEVARREAAQLPLAEKRARADHVIVNDDDLAALEAAVADLLDRLEATRTGSRRSDPEGRQSST